MEGPLVLLLCIVCFVIGFLSVALYVSWQQAVSLRERLTHQSPQWPHVGCKKVIELMKTRPPRAVEYKKTLTGVEVVDVELQKVISFGIRDYFERWYHPRISPDPICVQAAVDIVNHIVTEVSERSKQVDYLCFFVETIMDDIMEHLRQFKKAGQTCEDECEDGSWAMMTPSSKAKQMEKMFFEREPSSDPWRAVCLSQPARLAYLHRLTELLLCLLLPESDFSNAPLQVLLTGIIVHQVWLPLLRTLTQPDNVNSMIVSMSKENALNPETFMASIGDVLSDLELRVLQIKLQEHIRNLQRTGVTDMDQQKLSGLEALMETTKHLLDGSGAGGRKSSSQNSNMMSFNVAVPHFTIVSEGGSKHCLFKLSVECRHSQAAVVERWETHRRYRDFYDLHLTLRSELDHFPANLTIPSLPSFNKLDQKRLEVRRQSLQTYLTSVTSSKFLRQHPKAMGHLVLFLTEGHYTRTKTELTRMVDSLLFQPLRKTASMTIEAMKSTTAPLQPATSNGSPRSSPQLRKQISDVRPPPEEEEESLPVDMMLELLDELFDIRDGGQWIRRQLPLLLKQLAGGKISRKIVETSDWLTSAEQVSGYIRNLGNRLWPGGFPAVSHPTPPMDVKALRTLVARAQLIGSIPDDLKLFIGSDTTVRGMTRFFNMFQSEAMNYRLALVLIEGYLDTLLPDRNLKNTFRKLRIDIKKRNI